MASFAQTDLHYGGGVPVSRDGAALPLAWAGGLNNPQPSSIDLNGDGLLDIFIFDRSGNKPVFLLNTGTQGQAHYTVSHAYDSIQPFPKLRDWALLRDYDIRRHDTLPARWLPGWARSIFGTEKHA